MSYEKILVWWQKKRIRTATDITLELNGNGAAFIYHSTKIENAHITYHLNTGGKN